MTKSVCNQTDIGTPALNLSQVSAGQPVKLGRSRRLFLRQMVAIGVAGLVGSGLLTACGNGDEAERSEAETGPAGAAASGECEGSDDLAAGDVAARQAVNYVAESPQADKFCANCRFFKQPAAGAVCGECVIVKGPIVSQGYCNAWVAQS
jgi:hypothetical protein